MAWLKCENCGDLINTDNEPEAYIGTTDQWLCKECQEINAEINDKIAEGIRAAGYKIY